VDCVVQTHDARTDERRPPQVESRARPQHHLIALQQSAGNAAVARLVQRLDDPDALTPAMAQQLARRLKDAMDGWGTDEDAIYGVFTGRTQSQVDAIEAAYRTLFGRELTTDLTDELNAAELRRLATLAPAELAAPTNGTPTATAPAAGTPTPATPAPTPAASTPTPTTPAPASGTPSSATGVSAGAATPAPAPTPAASTPTPAALTAAADRANRAEVAARRLRSAMQGWGTDEDAIFAVLTGRSAAERREIADFYALTYGRTLEHDLRDEMSGSELNEALRLLGQGELSSADELYQAISGAGTDEARVMRVLEALGRNRGRIRATIADYQRKYGSLLVALNGDLSGTELTAARNHLGHVGHLTAIREVIAGADPDLLHQVPDFTIVSVADRLLLVARVHTETVVGDSDEGVLERIWGAADMAEPAAQNQSLYQASRNRGAEIPATLTTFGRFQNRFVQNMFEGGTTAGTGIFDWTLVGTRLNVRVPIKFQPARGVTPPYALWRTQINNVWNQYAAREPGGQSIQIQFTMVNDSSASRTVRVVKNKVRGRLSPEDRANAGMFFEVMRADTVPHEFGHFIGLPDEYQRTHGDFMAITGTDKTGPTNRSGRTEAQIADDLHTALHHATAASRRIEVRRVLTRAGLLVGGRAQQGNFAQDVMGEYDTRHGTLKDDLISQFTFRGSTQSDSGDRWLFQTVFSYASSSVMGNPGMFAPDPHQHPVEPRHLREFVSIVQERHPDKTWSMGPR
jgi:hypothetical protein